MKAKIYFISGLFAVFSLSVNAQNISTKVGTGFGGFAGDGGQGSAAFLNGPGGLALDATGNLYIADQYNNRIRKVDVAGVITTIAGTGTAGYNRDDTAATAAQLNQPTGVAVDAAGNVYIADKDNQRIRKVATNGKISTVAGNGLAGFYGDNDTATHVRLAYPSGVAVDDTGNIYIADQWNNRIRMVSSNGIISTIIGTGVGTYNGDFQPTPTKVAINMPWGVTVSPSGELYFTDTRNNIVRKLDKATGHVVTIKGTQRYSPQYGASTMDLHTPLAIAFDKSGNMYIADGGGLVKRLDTSGYYKIVAGTGVLGFSGDGGLATQAKISNIRGVTADAAGNIYIADSYNNRIRFVTPSVGTRDIVSVSKDWQVYPNPAAGGKFTVNFSSSAGKKVEVSIFDVAGRVVYNGVAETNKSFDISLRQPAGVYVINASSDGETWSGKISIID